MDNVYLNNFKVEILNKFNEKMDVMDMEGDLFHINNSTK